MEIIAKPDHAALSQASVETRAYAKATWRLLPFLFVCYVAAYLDRVNVGFAKLQMLNDLAFSETVYGLGAGIFFIGYFLFEVPSNIIMHRVGARVWIARIMITWAVISAASLFVKTPTTFYVMRFLLGVAEAGFFPGIVLYLTYWFPAERRGRMNALFMMGIPIAGVVGGPLSGWIMNAFQGVGGLSNWQWLFVLEAIPSAVLGVVTLCYLPNGIRAAKWLTDEEKRVLEANIERDNAGKTHGSLAGVFADARIWKMAAIYFCCMMGLYGISFYLPTLDQGERRAHRARRGSPDRHSVCVRCREHVSRRPQRGPHRRAALALRDSRGACGRGPLCQYATGRQHSPHGPCADRRDCRHACDHAGVLDLSECDSCGRVGGGGDWHDQLDRESGGIRQRFDHRMDEGCHA